MASQWYSVIGDTYSHKPLYFRGEDTDGRTAVLPAFFISHWLLGRTVTSMPFLDAGGPFGGGDRLTYALVKHLLTEADKLGAHRVEFRCTSEICLHIRPYLEKVTLTLPLPADPDRLWRDLDAKVRNQVRKAERAGVSVEIGGAQYLDEFYDVFAINMRDLGSPVHAKVFFQAILESFGQSARIALARRGTSPLGALISITFNDTVYVPWASSLREYAALCPNMLLYWETLRASCRAGVTRFDFGRSTRGSGTYRFKRQWGAQEAQLYWYSVPLREGSVTRLSANDRSGARMSRLWSKLPVRITRVLGPLIRGYLPQ
jgi:FemAB-related protein (PEP-CTERM system-associated)